MSSIHDSFLLSAIRAGDGKAYEHLFKVFYPRLHNFAMQYLKDEDAASDVVQSAFVKLYEKRSTFMGNSLSAIVFTILRNECLNELKHRVVVQEHEQQVLSAIDGEQLYNTDLLAQPERKLLYDELVEQVNSVVNELPARTQQVFKLRHINNLKNREIAEQLGISEKVVEKHLARAKQRFIERIWHEHLALALIVYISLHTAGASSVASTCLAQ
ncbi:MAG: RNA polymerase sigma-70 factor [Muribaculaceae bacterium]